MRGETGANTGVGRPLGQARQTGIHEAGSDTDNAEEHTAPPRGVQPANERLLQIVAKPRSKRPWVSPKCETMERSGKLHGRDFLAGSNRRARAAVTCPSSRAASCAATFRPCAVIR